MDTKKEYLGKAAGVFTPPPPAEAPGRRQPPSFQLHLQRGIFISSPIYPAPRKVDRKIEAPPSSPQIKWRGRQWAPADAGGFAGARRARTHRDSLKPLNISRFSGLQPSLSTSSRQRSVRRGWAIGEPRQCR